MSENKVFLVVESNPTQQAALLACLRTIDSSVIVAGDAVGALSMALRHKPRLIVLGDQIHAGGATVALRRLRSSVHTAAIPIVALAAPGHAMQALTTAGADE